MHLYIKSTANQADCTGGEASVQNRFCHYSLGHIGYVPKNKIGYIRYL